MKNELTFKKDLTSLINKYSLENGSNTPDFVLSEYLVMCLKAFNKSHQMKESLINKGNCNECKCSNVD